MAIHITFPKQKKTIKVSNIINTLEFENIMSNISKNDTLIFHNVSKRKTSTLRFYMDISIDNIKNFTNEKKEINIEKIKINRLEIQNKLDQQTIEKIKKIVYNANINLDYNSINLISNGGGINCFIENFVRSILKIFKCLQQINCNFNNTEYILQNNNIINIFSKNNIKIKERKKVGKHGARRSSQFSKR